MFTKKFAFATALILVIGLASAVLAWLAWPQLTWQPTEKAVWTVLSSNQHAQFFPRAQFDHPKQRTYHDPALTVGMRLEAYTRIRNAGIEEIRLTEPNGTVLVVPPSHSDTVLKYEVPDMGTRLHQLRAQFKEGGAVDDAWVQTSMPVARYMRGEIYVVLIMLLFWLVWLARRRAPGPASSQIAPLRGTLLAMLAASAVLWYVLTGLLGSLAWLDYMGGALSPRSPGPIGALGAALAWLKPAASLISVAGAFSVSMLAWRLGKKGKANLERSSLWLWAPAVMLVMLVVIGTGARFLPFIDLYSNLDAFFRQFETYARFATTALAWVTIGLLIERGIAPPDAPSRFLPPWWLLAFVLALSLALATVARVEPFANVQLQEERLAQLRENYCKASDVVVGQAHAFRIVEEAHCWRYDDGTPKGPERLGRCQSLEFDVNVIRQVWPLPEPGAAVRPLRTFRLSGSSAPVVELERDLILGQRQFDPNLRDITGPGPRVFYGKADSAGSNAILRNTLRGHVLSHPVARDWPFDEPGRMQVCGKAHELARKVIEDCNWEHAIVVTARQFSIVAADGKSINTLGWAPDDEKWRIPSHPLDERHLQADEQFEIELEIAELLEPSQPLKGRVLKMRFVSEWKFAHLRRLWLEPAGQDGEPSQVRKVAMLVREDHTEPGLLHLAHFRSGNGPPSLGLDSRRGGDRATHGVLAECRRARAAYYSYK